MRLPQVKLAKVVEKIVKEVKSPQELFLKVEQKSNQLDKVRPPKTKRQSIASSINESEVAIKGASKFKLSDFKDSVHSITDPITHYTRNLRGDSQISLNEQLNRTVSKSFRPDKTHLSLVSAI